MDRADFQEIVWEQGRALFRDMPWREDTAPYRVLVSELMLQQTQVDRVVPKFLAFMKAFPTIEALASASLGEVLTLWSGLGYNRRAKFLHQAAMRVVDVYGGVIPDSRKELESLPGVGKNTAGAILAYAYNRPEVFVETNIRTVFFHHFFFEQLEVNDNELQVLVRETLDVEHPREWYWALMDYGAYLKKQGVGLLDKSKHYKKQAPLKGSLRETRGVIVKELATGASSVMQLRERVAMDDRFDAALEGLVREGLVILHDTDVRLP